MQRNVPTILLVHGAWHGAWCWQRFTPHLLQRGFDFYTVELPSVGAKPGEVVNLSADAAAVKTTLEAISGPVILCGHSYGGMVISLAAAAVDAKVERLIYICAYVPEAGQSLTAARVGKRAPWIRMLDGGLTLPDLEQAAGVFYADCDPATQRWARHQLRAQSNAAFEEPVPAPAWKRIPSTYIVCTRDRAIPPAMQREVFAPRTTSVVELQSGHSPFLSQPGELADLILRP
jgi:pimeloyl-ACP methyl ester carboxylesterase